MPPTSHWPPEYPHVARAEDLPSAGIDFQDAPSFLCIGEPPAIYKKAQCGIITINDKISMAELFNRVSIIFHKYNKWETDVKTAIASNQPLPVLGRLTEPIFNNPVGLYDHGFRCFFLVVNPDHYPNPYENQEFSGGTYLPGEDIELLKYDEAYIDSVNQKGPTIFPADQYGYRSLYMNIFSENDRCIARIVVDEISHKFTLGEFSLIAIFADFIKLALQSNGLFDFRVNTYTAEVLEKMLSHVYVEEERITTVLQQAGWDCFDDYFCFVVYPSEFDLSTMHLNFIATSLSTACPSAKYIVFNEKIIFIINLTVTEKSQDEAFHLFLPMLRDQMLKSSISTVFSDFKNLYYYYKQCNIAMSLGKKQFSTRWYYKFEDSMLDYVIECSIWKFIPEALYPEGLLRLIAHDHLRGTDYTMILRTYLENNMSPTATLKKLYMHRNTFAYRLEKLREILDMDLEDPDVRLSLLLALKILDRTAGD